MFNKILFPTDLSMGSNSIENYLVDSNKDNGIKDIVILNVIDQKMIDAVSFYDKKHEFLKAVRQDRQEIIDKKIVPKLTAAGYNVKILIKEGFPVKEILNTIAEEDVELVIMASHGKGNHKGHLIGSVSEKVVRHVKKPILVFKE
jgi:nucleotide-binding universal stress UspA family protein